MLDSRGNVPIVLGNMADSPPRLLLCFDFDGTMLQPDAQPAIHPEFLDCLSTMKERGAVWAINTGRSLFQTIAGLGDYQIRPLPDFIIAKEREIYEPTRFNRWIDLGDWNRRCQKDHVKLFRSYRKFFSEMREFIEEHTGAQYVESEQEPAGVVARDEAEMDLICQFINDRHAKFPLLGYERNSIYLRFGHVDYNKGTALAELARMLGLDAQYTFAAGDNHNDLSMLEVTVASMTACPSNAVPEVVEKVRSNGGFVAPVPSSAGLVHALAHYFAEQPANA